MAGSSEPLVIWSACCANAREINAFVEGLAEVKTTWQIIISDKKLLDESVYHNKGAIKTWKKLSVAIFNPDSPTPLFSSEIAGNYRNERSIATPEKQYVVKNFLHDVLMPEGYHADASYQYPFF